VNRDPTPLTLPRMAIASLIIAIAAALFAAGSAYATWRQAETARKAQRTAEQAEETAERALAVDQSQAETAKQALETAKQAKETAERALNFEQVKFNADHPPEFRATVEWEYRGDGHWLRLEQVSGVALKVLDVTIVGGGAGEADVWFMPHTSGVPQGNPPRSLTRAHTSDLTKAFTSDESGSPAGISPGQQREWSLDFDKGVERPAELEPMSLLVSCSGYNPAELWENLRLDAPRAESSERGFPRFGPPPGLPEAEQT